MPENKSNLKTGIGILVLALANTTAAGAEWCSAALTTIAENFPETPYWVITLLNNIPNLCAVFMTIIAGLLVNRKIGLKTMMLIGIGFHAVGGFLPVFLGGASIYLVLLSRIIFGIGYGIMQGICVSMTFKLITNTKLREHAMGWAVASQYAMNMFAQVAVGKLVAVQWNYSFFIYAWGIIPFIIVAIFCPKFALDKNDRSAIGGEATAEEPLGVTLSKLPFIVWAACIAVLIFMMGSCSAIFLNLGPIIIGKLGHEPVMIGTCMISYSVATIVGGLVFGAIAKACKHFTMFVSMVISAAGILIFTFAPNLTVLCVGLFVAGVGGTLAVPACQSVFAPYVPKHRAFVASAIVMASVNIGAFASTPYIAVFEAAGQPSTATLIPTAVMMVVLGIITIFVWKKAEKLEVVA